MVNLHLYDADATQLFAVELHCTGCSKKRIPSFIFGITLVI